MLAVAAVVGTPFLLPMGRIVRTVDVQDDAERDAVALVQVDLAQGQGQPVTGAAVDGILQARQGWLIGQIAPGFRQVAADQLQERVGAQEVCIVLVLIPAGDLEDALADQGRHSGVQAAKAAHSPSTCSAWSSQGSPSSEVSPRRQNSPPRAAERGRESEQRVWKTGSCGRLPVWAWVNTAPISKR